MKPFSVEWQLARALAEIDRLRGEVRALEGARITDARVAANRTLEASGHAPIYDRQDPEPTTDKERIIYRSPEEKAFETIEHRKKCRLAFAELMDIPYQETVDADARGKFEVPEWNIYSSLWWATIGQNLADAKEAKLREEARATGGDDE